MKQILLIAFALLLSACATQPQINEGQRLIASGQPEAGLAILEQAARSGSRNAEAYTTWITQRELVVRGYVREGDAQRGRSEFDAAEASYRRALSIDPKSVTAQGGLDAVARERRHQALAQQAADEFKRGELAAADRDARAVLAENSNHRLAKTVMKQLAEKKAGEQAAPPMLSAALNKPVTLEFRDAPLRAIFEVLARSAGINFVFDRDVRQDLRATIFMRDSNLDEVIRTLLVTNQLDRKVLNENSMLIFPNTPAKQREYQELAMRSFYLANADVKQTAAMIRALVKTRDIYIDEKLNLLVMKDTPEAIRLAEQLVATQDLAEPEVMLDVEVLEVASNLLRDFGLRYPDQINFGVLSPDANLPSNIELKPRTWEYFVANPGLLLNIHQLDGAVNLLANPRIRVRNREKAKVHIGEKVPVITTTSTANVGVSSSVSYLETGLKLDVEPNVYLENEVAIKVELEVSNILEQLNVSGTVSYRLGTRNAATTLRLHDGETQVLAGLINDEDRRSANKLPYLGDFPILGRLFRSDSDSHNKTEIVLLITPHIVRNLARPGTVQAQFSSGTDAAPGAMPLRLSSTAPGAFSLSSTDAGALVSSAAADRINSDADAGGAMTLAINGPAQASIGEDFILSFGLPVHIEGATARLQLNYDPAVLALVGGASGDGGNAELAVSAATIAGSAPAVAQARFRVIAKVPGTTQIGVALLSASDNLNRPLDVQAPAAHNLNIVGREGGNIYTPQPIIPAPTIPVTPNATSEAAPDAAAAPIEVAPQ